MKLERIDVDILQALQRDAHAKAAALAESLGLSPVAALPAYPPARGGRHHYEVRVPAGRGEGGVSGQRLRIGRDRKIRGKARQFRAGHPELRRGDGVLPD